MRRIWRFDPFILCALAILCVAMALPPAAQGQVTGQKMISVSTSGVAGSDDSGPGMLAMSASACSSNGAYVAYSSAATNLVNGDTNNFRDIFLYDRANDLTTKITFDYRNNGSGADGASGLSTEKCSTVAISADGSKVAYLSDASNLDISDLNSARDVFIYDTSSGTNKVQTKAGLLLTSPKQYCVALSADGATLAFSGDADLLPGDINLAQDVYVKNLSANTFELISVNNSNPPVCGNNISTGPSISDDGNLVAYVSDADNLVPNDLNHYRDVFLRRRQASTTELVSVSSSGAQSNGPSEYAKISGDGKFVAFVSSGNNLVSGDTNGVDDVFVRDLVNGTTTRVSVDDAGHQALYPSYGPISISQNGRYIAFQSEAMLVASPSIPVNYKQVYVRDTVGNHTYLLTENVGGSLSSGGGQSSDGFISADGTAAIFDSQGYNLVQSPTANNYYQMFETVTGLSGGSNGGGGGGGPAGGGPGGGDGGHGASGLLTLTPKLKLTDPPVVEVGTDRQVTIVLPLFTFTPPTRHKKSYSASSFVFESAGGVGILAGKSAQIVYEVTIKAQDSRAAIKKTIKRNTLTLKYLKPGNYSVSYNVRAVKGGKILAKSRQSPAANFSVQ